MQVKAMNVLAYLLPLSWEHETEHKTRWVKETFTEKQNYLVS